MNTTTLYHTIAGNKIPRKASTFPLQTQFITNADGCGDHVFTQLKRNGNVCLYERHRVSDGIHCGYEVFLTKLVPAGSPFPGGGVSKVDYEPYPGGAGFGKTAWACNPFWRAEEKFEWLVKREAQKASDKVASEGETPIEESKDIPPGEFTKVEFSTFNCMAPGAQAYTILKGLILEGLVKESKRVSKGPGAPTVYYKKV